MPCPYDLSIFETHHIGFPQSWETSDSEKNFTCQTVSQELMSGLVHQSPEVHNELAGLAY